jgi:hypothetical protein
MESNNVVQFPKNNKNITVPELSLENINRDVEMMKHYHIQETITTLAPIIFNQLEISGFALAEDEDHNLKDGTFIVEALRSIMCKSYGIYHPFQVIAENVFIPESENDSTLKVVDNINVELKKV